MVFFSLSDFRVVRNTLNLLSVIEISKNKNQIKVNIFKIRIYSGLVNKNVMHEKQFFSPYIQRYLESRQTFLNNVKWIIIVHKTYDTCQIVINCVKHNILNFVTLFSRKMSV